MAIGWRARDLAPLIGWASGELDTVFRRPTVRRVTAEAVARVYVRLADMQGPSEQTRRRATRAGWLAPLWWDDDTIDDATFDPRVEFFHTFDRQPDRVAVERFINGGEVALNRAEKCCAYREMLRRGVPRREIVARLRISWATSQAFAAADCGEPVALVIGGGQNDNGADQRANADRLLTETPAYPGGRRMPSIAPHDGDTSQRVVA